MTRMTNTDVLLDREYDEKEEILKKYSNLGELGLLLSVTEYATREYSTAERITDELSESFSKEYNISDETNDLLTLKDNIVHGSISSLLYNSEEKVFLLGEEGQEDYLEDPEYAVIIDEVEGTQNSLNDLPFGVNVMLVKYDTQIRPKDIIGSVVTNYDYDKFFVAMKNEGVFKTEIPKDHNLMDLYNKKVRDSDPLEPEEIEKIPLEEGWSDLYEVPLFTSYTTEEEQKIRQKILGTEILPEVFGNQPRSIDATGTILAEVADSNRACYGDWRNATKVWDVIPSWLILKEAGYEITDVLGFEFGETIIYDENDSELEKDGGLNRKVGQNFFAGGGNKREEVIFGPESHFYLPNQIKSTWDYVLSEKGFDPFEIVLNQQPNKRENFRDLGVELAEKVASVVSERREDYKNLEDENIKEIVEKVSEKYLDIFEEEDLPEGENIHLDSYWEKVEGKIPEVHN